MTYDSAHRRSFSFYMSDASYADHVASFEAHHRHINLEKKPKPWGRVRYLYPYVDTAFQAWAEGRARLLHEMDAVVSNARKAA